ncbi:MAG TPA: sugar ABC transporter ATP-binding protein [Gemmataceae bacterium]|nr:sugar ABC transporter ATP-binding protein [Gemmataceae bacterium]
MQTLLQATGISKSFAGIHALRDVSFELLPGEVHALVGENGAGKSTLVKILTGAYQADEGLLEVAGQPVTHNDPVKSRALGIAAIYQQPALFPDLSVAENMALGVEPGGAWRRIRWDRRRQRAKQLLDRVSAAIDLEATVRDLTMPEQQLIEIARALGADARILIMDEPTASLSEREVSKLFKVIRDLRNHGVGIIYISHRLEELFEVGDRVTVLRDGVEAGRHRLTDIDRGTLIRLMVGRELSAAYPKVPAQRGAVALELSGIGCRESGVRDVDLSLRSGEIVGLAGLVGAGRTELAQVLFGLTPADAGSMRVHGKHASIRSPAQAMQLGIAYLPEDRRHHGVILDMPLTGNVTLAILSQIAKFGLLNFARERSLAESFVQQLGIKTGSIDETVGNLSGGNQQKVALARWLAASPTILILDEPTQGIDVGAKWEIYRLMTELASRGMAILMISSELPEILGMSDRIAVMHAGSLVGIHDRADSDQEKIMALALGHKQIGPGES